MKLFIFAVRDSASDQFGNPMFLISSGQAMRSFTDEVNREAPDNLMFQHPDDFELFELGEFDTVSGVFDTTRPISVTSGKAAKIRSVDKST